MDDKMMNQGEKCTCPHHGVVPVILIFLGALFFMKALGVFSAGMVDITWPVLVMIAGFTKLGGRMCKCC